MFVSIFIFATDYFRHVSEMPCVSKFLIDFEISVDKIVFYFPLVVCWHLLSLVMVFRIIMRPMVVKNRMNNDIDCRQIAEINNNSFFGN
jgi:hypothetical protein